MLQYEYGRSALRLGLQLMDELGTNPYQFGITAATDAHTGLATTREENYFGKYAQTELSPTHHTREVIPASDPALRVMTSQQELYETRNVIEVACWAHARRKFYEARLSAVGPAHQAIAALPKSPIGEALQYALRRWESFTRYAADGRLSIDNNIAERALRSVAIGRKNSCDLLSRACA